MIACDTCLVRNRAICSVLDSEELADLNRIGRRKKVRRGETLIWEGDDAPVVANVVEGMLKLTTATGDGRRARTDRRRLLPVRFYRPSLRRV